MSDEVLIKVENVSKRFCRDLKKSLWYGVQDVISDLNPFARNGVAKNGHAQSAPSAINDLRKDEFWAVNNVTFELRRGECLGLIGRNGAGKTTLLKMLNGLIKPDQGSITMRGRVGALIALGAGFNPILTGRENVYVNGSVLGLAKKEIDRKIEDIIAFADIKDFINAPVQSYSSGMQVRLGFAVATALEPDILLLDEVLAVGDAAFRAKCYNRIGKLQKSAAVIFVSHSMEQISRICSGTLVMSKGRPILIGTPQAGVAAYENENSTDVAEETFLTVADPITDTRLRFSPETIDSNDSVALEIEIRSEAAIKMPVFHGVFYDTSGTVVASFVTQPNRALFLSAGVNHARIEMDHIPLAAGVYVLGLSMSVPSSITNLVWSYKQARLEIRRSCAGFCACRLPARIQITVPPRRCEISPLPS